MSQTVQLESGANTQRMLDNAIDQSIKPPEVSERVGAKGSARKMSKHRNMVAIDDLIHTSHKMNSFNRAGCLLGFEDLEFKIYHT